MNCSQTKSRLVAYLNGEVPPLEKESIRAHLVTCTICQGELQSLSDLEDRLAQYLRVQAEQAHAAPGAWNALQARISLERAGGGLDGLRSISTRLHFERQTTRRLVFALIIILGLLLTAPPTWTLAARISDWVGSWFHFETPGTENSLGVGGFEAFTPYSPQYLPDGFDGTGIGGTTAPDLEILTLTYEKGKQFISLLQSKGPGLDELPRGSPVKIDGEMGVFVQVFATSSKDLQQKIPSIPIVENLDWSTTSLLAWQVGEIRLELVSNLPKEEILRVARSLVPAESNEEKTPPNQKP